MGDYQIMSNKQQILDTIKSITTECNYSLDYKIYYIASELAQSGYVVLTRKAYDILKQSKETQS